MVKEKTEEINPPELLQKGKYVFIDQLSVIENSGSSVPFIVAKAIVVAENKGGFRGDIPAAVKLSDLILKQSVYIDENGRSLEAHKLYTWPRNLGSTSEWTACKQQFLQEFVLYFPIEVLSVQGNDGVTWRFITPENFKKLPEGIEGSESFQEFAAHTEDYFFLRRPIVVPK